MAIHNDSIWWAAATIFEALYPRLASLEGPTEDLYNAATLCLEAEAMSDAEIDAMARAWLAEIVTSPRPRGDSGGRVFSWPALQWGAA